MIIQTSIRVKDNVVKSVSGAVNYILSNLDSSGQKRSVKPEIIYGNPDLIRSYDSHPKMGTKNKSTSGVISLRDGEQLTKEQEELLVHRFQELIIPEQFRDVVDMFLVKHQDKGNIEYHFVIPHLTLEGKKFNPFAVIGRDYGRSAFQSAQAATRILNDEFGFNQVQINPESKKGLVNREIKQQKHQSITSIRSKTEFAESCISLVKAGKINNKEELIGVLKSAGYSITRNGENYLSIKREGWGRAMRLESGIFANDSEKAYAKLQTQTKKAEGKSSTVEPYTAEHKARDEQLVKTFHALVVDKYEGKRANMNSLFQEFKQIQNQQISPLDANAPAGIKPSTQDNRSPVEKSPITAQSEHPAPVAPTDKPKAHTASIQVPQPASPGNPPGQQEQQPAIAGSQGLGGSAVASSEGEAQAAVQAASSAVSEAEKKFGRNSPQYSNAMAALGAAQKRLQQIQASNSQMADAEKKKAQVKKPITPRPQPQAPNLNLSAISIRDKLSGIANEHPKQEGKKKSWKYGL
ncbi:relaxase/mobilization nuclease domain-containing protein [Castellaniella sp.]|uniref:relaxase/mobilization nuclease domain-containing protein n=1 Tax=Castellaniella sp. TaxID=1955812 RepID=UPI002AFE2C7D|nr:relaxase/mobilization nuclease domain-containing protein [Castellaniella sp.]